MQNESNHRCWLRMRSLCIQLSTTQSDAEIAEQANSLKADSLGVLCG